MRLSELVDTSGQVRATRSRRRKIAVIGDCLRGAAATELPAAVSYLAGRPCQGLAAAWELDEPTVRRALMLASTATSLEEAVKACGTCAVEGTLDGAACRSTAPAPTCGSTRAACAR